jgi:hypothetical protein
MKTKYFFIVLFVALMSCNTTKKEDDKTEAKSEIVKKEAVKKVPKNQKLSTEEQIASAIIAVPMEGREGATVYGYDENGDLIVMREGDNNFVCIADNPNKDGFQVVAYHKSLEPMMSRGRELNKAGKSRQEKEAARSSEAKSGKLKMPENPATLHIYYGENGFFNTESGEIENAKYRYVVYIPYATQESTGLSLKPNESNHPWLMFPGQYNAHIMISPKE